MKPTVSNFPTAALALNGRALKLYLWLLMHQDPEGFVRGQTYDSICTHFPTWWPESFAPIIKQLVASRLVARVRPPGKDQPNAYYIEDVA